MHSKRLLPRMYARKSGTPGQMTLSASNTVPFRSRPHSCKAQDKLEGERVRSAQRGCSKPTGQVYLARWGLQMGA